MSETKSAVIALGGNAITVPGVEDTIANQFANTRKSLEGIVELIRNDYNLVITHGNGPQVGNCLLRIELSREMAPTLPLGVLVADTEGGMGYMIAQSLQNRLRAEGLDRKVVTIVTQVLVDKDDPAIKDPTKFIGQFYTPDEAKEYSETRGWHMKKDADRGFRRVVPSPIPVRTIEADAIRQLVQSGTIVIAGGGGGIPVYLDDNGDLEGIDAVIDKDHTSAVIAREIGAETLSILTSVDRVSLNYAQPDQKDLEEVTYSQMQEYVKQGHFPPGSMGPKVKAALCFLQEGGKLVTISSFADAGQAVLGRAGTRIVAE